MTRVTRRDAIAITAGAAVARPQETPGSLPVSVLYYGSEEPLPRQIALQAGPLRMLFEPELAQLRYIRLGEREVLRAVYAAVRDRNWGTVKPRISGMKTEITDGAFRIDIDIECKHGPIDFIWHGAITGGADGTVKFGMDGQARSTFLRNRIGFCVLHSEDCAGQPAVLEKTDGSVQKGRFPDDISPHQPFMDMRAIRHTAAPGIEAEVSFEGDVFEMEDQRNWTDGSYKTYCTPLARPFPVEVKEGSRIRQSVTLSISGKAPAARAATVAPAETLLTIDEARSRPLPLVGAGLSSVSSTLSATERNRLRAAGLSHLRADVKPADPATESLLDRAVNEAKGIGAALEIAVTLGPSPETELERFAALLQSRKPRVLQYLVFHQDEKSTSERSMELARTAIRKVDPSARVASGTNAYFTELNRGRPPLGHSDAVCYSINPQVHAFDNLSLVETLEMQAVTLASARKFCGDLPIAVTPVTLKPRFNPNATEAPARTQGPPHRLPDEVDVRQMSLFGAGWTLGSLKYLAEGGAASVTYYETTGWRGLMETEGGNPLPAQFRSTPGAVFPLYHVLADACEFSGGQAIGCRSSDVLRMEGLILQKGKRRRLLLANLSPELQAVRIPNAGLGRAVRVTVLDEHTAGEATRKPEQFRKTAGRMVETGSGTLQIALLPYAVAKIDPA
jgi:hypothetical protein